MRRSHLTLALAIGCLAGLAGAAEPDSFGRLFFSPAERLERDRPRAEAPAAPVVAAPIDLGPMRLDGIVRRSDGTTVIWIDGAPAEPSAAVVGQDGRSATLALPDGRQHHLLVGESVLPDSSR
ncbi:MAG: hypothetical protein KDH20_20520 [Rhodocyclaceae bacterium]|nr:hypothetical protein [Rhodocyclaceae bacterium]